MDHYTHTIHTWNQLADQYQEKFMDLDLYNDTYDQFCQLVQQPNARVLEIGCGPGNVTRYLLAKRPDFTILGTDVAPTMVELAGKNVPGAGFAIMDARETGRLSSTFDAILCGFCMPYLSKEDCIQLIKDCARLLNDGGIFYFSTIEGEYASSKYETSSNGEHTMFIHYHEESYLRRALEESNCEVVHMERKIYAKTGGTSSDHIIIMARKKADQ